MALPPWRHWPCTPTMRALQVIGKRKKLLHEMRGAMALEVRKGLATGTADAATDLVREKAALTLE